MTTEQIYEHLDKMLADAKTKNFLNHLIRAYTPTQKISQIIEKPKGQFKCVLTGQELISAQEIFEGMSLDTFRDDMIKHIKSSFKEGTEKIESPMKELLKDRVLGFTGTNTTTYMSYEAVKAFVNWIAVKILANDKHISWLLRTIRKENMIKEEAENPKPKPNNYKGKTATFALGDLATFKNLKDKFKDDEN